MVIFGGSGGFQTIYSKYMKKQSVQRNIGIDWKTQVKNLYLYDNNLDGVKSARIEILSITGFIPPNFQKRHSFYDSVTEKFDYIFTNPPYGGDKKTEKMKLFDSNQQIKSIGIKENKVIITGDNK